MNIILLGPPGAGKGTMAEYIENGFNLDHISTGDMLREEIKKGSELGKSAEKYMNKGELVPDKVILGMIEMRLKEKAARHGIMLDGFPRNLAQAKALDKIAKIDVVILLEATRELVIERALNRRVCAECGEVYSAKLHKSKTCDKCGGKLIKRDDDTEETINKRFDVFEESTAPLIDYYKKKDIVAIINADQPIKFETAAISGMLDYIKYEKKVAE
ncbi:MAG: adenylate kinase [Christensenellaceae bacterium]|nr:adenylate kinase [Christensenellaceae bacterium]